MRPYATHVPGQTFPAFPRPEGAVLLGLLHQLAESEWASPEELVRLQWLQLAPLLDHARANVPGYKKLWRDVPWPLSGPADLSRLPPLERDRLQAQPTAFRSHPMPTSHGAVRPMTTSGSTGKPVEVLQSEVQRVLWAAYTLRHHQWHGIDPAGRLASIRFVADRARGRPPKGDERPSWGMPEDQVYRTGPSALLDLATPVDQQIVWLRRQDPDWFVTFPTNLHALVEESVRTGGRPPRLRGIWTVGEALSAETRALVKEAWGVPVWDMYSSQEVGYIALQCPTTGCYHTQESVLVEVVDDNGRACGPGQVGRVLVTALSGIASPLIRYAIGDWAERGPERCACGRGLPVLNRILGRTRNMMRLPGGRRAWPYIESVKCRAAAPYRQMQVVQTALDAIEVRVVPDGTLSDAHRTALKAELTRSLGHPFAFTFQVVDAIERSASGKFEEFMCRVPEES